MQVEELDHLLSSLQHGLQEREVFFHSLALLHSIPPFRYFLATALFKYLNLIPPYIFHPPLEHFSMALHKKGQICGQ